MGDMSREPSMEDILSSIRRVIARDETTGTVRAARPAAGDDVLDLHDEEPETVAQTKDVEAKTTERKAAEPAAVEPVIVEPVIAEPVTVEPVTVEPEAETVEYDEELVSPASADAARQSLDALSAAIAPPPAPAAASTSGRTMEDVVVDTLRPMLKEWLDTNLPPLVEAMVAKEISRITRRRR